MDKQKRVKSVYANKMIQWLGFGCLLLLVIGYLLQAFSPLRLTRDTYRLLSMAVSAYNGEGYLVNGHPDQYPLLYPFIVKIMLQMHIANSMTLVIINLLCLLGGLLLLRALTRSQSGSLRTVWLVIFVLSSWVMLRCVVTPLTELMYLFLSMAALFFVWRFWCHNGSGKWQYFFIAALFGCLSFNCRSAGLTIFPVLAITAVLHEDNAPLITGIITRRLYMLATICACAAVLFPVAMIVRETAWYKTQFMMPGSYFQFILTRVRDEGAATFLILNIHSRIIEFGDIFTNLPADILERLFPIRYIFGLIAWCIVLYGTRLVFRVKNLVPLAVYLLSYIGLMVTWPWYDSRFWLPVIPILAIMLFAGSDSLVKRWPVARLISICYLTCFTIIGIMVIIFNARISLSGKEFSELYEEQDKLMIYRFAFQNGKYVDMSKVDKRGVRILKIFEPLANIPPDKK